MVVHTLLPHLTFEILKILIYYGLFFKCQFVYLDDLLIKFVLWWEFLVSELNWTPRASLSNRCAISWFYYYFLNYKVQTVSGLAT